jgi:AraC-like DNA-binding protein
VELLADPCVNIAFERGASRVVGVSTRLWGRVLAGAGQIRAVKLKAGAARAFFPAPVAALTDHVVHFGACFDEEEGVLERRILESTDDREAFACFEAWLIARCIAPLASEVGFAVKIVERVRRDPSVVTAARVAEVAGVSLRTLQRMFHEHVGASPKWVARRFRLQEAALRIERGEAVSLATLAAQLGYADHAHLTRDFKDTTGRTPKAFGRRVWE